MAALLAFTCFAYLNFFHFVLLFLHFSVPYNQLNLLIVCYLPSCFLLYFINEWLKYLVMHLVFIYFLKLDLTVPCYSTPADSRWPFLSNILYYINATSCIQKDVKVDSSHGKRKRSHTGTRNFPVNQSRICEIKEKSKPKKEKKQ